MNRQREGEILMSASEPETVFPTPPVQEPTLLSDPHTGRWTGANASFSVWMDDATFRASVAAWYEWPTWLPDLPHARTRGRRLLLLPTVVLLERLRTPLRPESPYHLSLKTTPDSIGSDRKSVV